MPPHACVLQVGLWIMVQHMRDRNYLAANDVYLKLAIGNAPWPIGERSLGFCLEFPSTFTVFYSCCSCFLLLSLFMVLATAERCITSCRC